MYFPTLQNFLWIFWWLEKEFVLLHDEFITDCHFFSLRFYAGTGLFGWRYVADASGRPATLCG